MISINKLLDTYRHTYKLKLKQSILVGFLFFFLQKGSWWWYITRQRRRPPPPPPQPPLYYLYHIHTLCSKFNVQSWFRNCIVILLSLICSCVYLLAVIYSKQLKKKCLFIGDEDDDGGGVAIVIMLLGIYLQKYLIETWIYF